MAQHNITGGSGEKKAIKYLSALGYKMLETNWKFHKAEIDIIARDGDIIVVAEVKTRTGDYFAAPEDAVDRKKQKHLIKAADAYVKRNDIDMEVRFDIISVLVKNGKIKIEHIQNAFYPTL